MSEDVQTAASVTFEKWGGTAALDDPHEDSPLKVLGIDGDRWLLLGFSMFGGWESFYNVIAYVVDRELLEEGESLDALQARSGGKLPVVELTDLPATALDVLREFKEFSIKVWSRPRDDYAMEITDTISAAEDET